MKQLKAIKVLLPVLLVAFTFTQCDIQDSGVGSFDDVTDKVPDFQVMPGAESVTMKVERNNDRGYFNIDLSNVAMESEVLDGSYLGWCAHWSAPIDARGEVYDDVTLYSTRYDKNWNKLNYVLNHKVRYFRDIEGVSYKEIQAAIWTLIDFKEFDIDENQIFDNLNREAYDAVMSDVEANGKNFQHGPGTIHAVFADLSKYQTSGEPTQTVVFGKGQTAWGGDVDAGGPPGPHFNYFDTNLDNEQGIVVGATKIPAGTVMVSDPDNGKVTITINLDNDGLTGWFLQEGNETVKIQGYDSPPSFSAPGGYFYKTSDLVVEVDAHEYYAIHLDVVEATLPEP